MATIPISGRITASPNKATAVRGIATTDRLALRQIDSDPSIRRKVVCDGFFPVIAWSSSWEGLKTMMQFRLAAVAMLMATMPSTAFADDPRDPAMRNSEARQRDAEMVRKLNQQESDRVLERDAACARGKSSSRDYAKARADYERDYARYEQDMAKWRRATAACRAGDYSACAR